MVLACGQVARGRTGKGEKGAARHNCFGCGFETVVVAWWAAQQKQGRSITNKAMFFDDGGGERRTLGLGFTQKLLLLDTTTPHALVVLPLCYALWPCVFGVCAVCGMVSCQRPLPFAEAASRKGSNGRLLHSFLICKDAHTLHTQAHTHRQAQRHRHDQDPSAFFCSPRRRVPEARAWRATAYPADPASRMKPTTPRSHARHHKPTNIYTTGVASTTTFQSKAMADVGLYGLAVMVSLE